MTATHAVFPKNDLAHPNDRVCLDMWPVTPDLPPPPMILVAIFSVIILLLCWVCYSGDCNNS